MLRRPSGPLLVVTNFVAKQAEQNIAYLLRCKARCFATMHVKIHACVRVCSVHGKYPAFMQYNNMLHNTKLLVAFKGTLNFRLTTTFTGGPDVSQAFRQTFPWSHAALERHEPAASVSSETTD